MTSDVNTRRAELGLPPLIAEGSRWTESLHPRDRFGKWIDKLSRVRILGRSGTADRGGMIEKMNPDGSARVRLTWAKDKLGIGSRLNVPATDLEAIQAKAVLDAVPGEQVLRPKKPWAPSRPVLTGSAADLATGGWADLQKALAARDVIVFDTETTGFDVRPGGKDKLVEIGAVKVRGGTVVDRFQTMVNPGVPIDPEASAITGITDESVKDAPDAATVFGQFKQFAGDGILAAHNANFDMDMLDSLAHDSGLPPMENGVLDTLALARATMPPAKVGGPVENHKLGTLASFFDVSLENAHRADADAEATAEVLNKLLTWAAENNAPTTSIQDLGAKIAEYQSKLAAYQTQLDEWRKTL